MEQTIKNNKKIKNTAIILISTALILITVIIHLNYPLIFLLSPSLYSSYNENSSAIHAGGDINKTDDREKCDIFTGEWVRNADAPYYTNTTCWAIHEQNNCIKYGRPDLDFLKWRWKPDGCELPVMNPYRFLDMARGKKMAFVGDSVARNQVQSMICLLSRVEYPIDVSTTSDDHFRHLSYVNYNFTLAYFWTPFLVRFEERDPDGPAHTGLFNLYLDESDESWTSQIDGFDYLVLNAGHWFPRTTVYYENRRIVGCRYCKLPNVTEYPMAYGYRYAFQTAFKAINERKNFSGMTLLRTFAPAHFENGMWNEGGDCPRRRPYRSNEKILEGDNLDMYVIQSEELKAAQKEGKKEFRLLDTTHAMLLRPDGHPSRYGHWPDQNVTFYNDCVHWCLPGPIDSWADFLAHIMKMEARRTSADRLFQR